MNCEEFQDVVISIARRESMDAALSAQAHGHARACLRCAALLADARALGEELALLAADDQEKQAPLHVESALQNEFRKGTRAALRMRAIARWSAGAAAAVCLLLLGGAASRWLIHRDAPRPGSAVVRPAEQGPRVVEPNPGAGSTLASEQADAAMLAAQQNVWGSAVRAQELTTEFFPFSNNLDTEPFDDATLVRVKLPRAAMASYGFWVSEEHAAEWVNADVVLGEDGQPRAIRFVR
jgi:hypothetical protein